MDAIGISALKSIAKDKKLQYIGVIEPKKIDLSKYVINNRDEAICALRKHITELEQHVKSYPNDLSAREQLATLNNLINSYASAC